MEDFPLLGLANDRQTMHQFMAAGGAPAFAVRAVRVHEALDHLVAQCRKRRTELLQLVRVRVGTLRALAGGWAALRALLHDEQQEAVLGLLCYELQPRLQLGQQQTRSLRTLRRALDELIASLERFNQMWHDYVRSVDLSRVNELREGYNRFYVLEKECLVGSPQLARQGFRPLSRLTVDDLLIQLPPLPVPVAKKKTASQRTRLQG